jgi:two-component system sensor histidine kinase PilS (NtrC family)
VEPLDKNFSLNAEVSTYVNIFLMFILGGGLIFSFNYELITPPITVVITQALVVCLGLVLSTFALLKILKKAFAYFLFLAVLYFIFFSPHANNLSFFVTVLSINVFLAFLTLQKSQAFLIGSVSFFLLTLHLFVGASMWSDYSPYQYAINFLTFVVYGSGGLYIRQALSENKDLVGLLNLRLQRESDLNEAIVSSLASGVLIHDSKKFRALNPSARALIKDHPKLLKCILDNLKNGAKNEKGSFDFESQRSFYRIHFSALGDPEGSEETSYVILVSDETDYRARQKELESAKKLAAVGTLSAGLAHEIRNPLAGMSGSIELLKEGDNPEEVNKKLFNSLLKEIDRLNHLVTDFLSFSVPTVHRKDKINLKVFLSNTLDELQLNPKAKGVGIDYTLEDFLIKVDEPKLKQVILNIVLNAVEAFDNDHILKLEKNGLKPKVEIIGKSLGHKYSLIVKDNGSGISEFDLEKIFEPFHTTKDKGTGLGLALSHRILKEHGALVQVESDLGAGTTFKIEFKN